MSVVVEGGKEEEDKGEQGEKVLETVRRLMGYVKACDAWLPSRARDIM